MPPLGPNGGQTPGALHGDPEWPGGCSSPGGLAFGTDQLENFVPSAQLDEKSTLAWGCLSEMSQNTCTRDSLLPGLGEAIKLEELQKALSRRILRREFRERRAALNQLREFAEAAPGGGSLSTLPSLAPADSLLGLGGEDRPFSGFLSPVLSRPTPATSLRTHPCLVDPPKR